MTEPEPHTPCHLCDAENNEALTELAQAYEALRQPPWQHPEAKMARLYTTIERVLAEADTTPCGRTRCTHIECQIGDGQ